METLLWWTSVISVVLIVMVLVALRRAHIRVEYSVTWLIACVALFALSRSETVLGWIASDAWLGLRPDRTDAGGRINFRGDVLLDLRGDFKTAGRQYCAGATSGDSGVPLESLERV